MSAADIDIDQLSDGERAALDTYTTVTGQEPSEAILLLRRSQWNVQIAISKFFDGEGPDPVEEARAVMNRPPPPQPGRRPQNLMTDDLTSQFAPRTRAAEPAPRIRTFAEDQTVYRPPYLLALLFTPFNILYRLLYNSLRLFGTFFPFLPRFLNFTSSALQRGLSNTYGRRPLGPKDTAARFIREFEEEYGSNTLPFLESGYNMAMENAHRDLKFLLVVLLSPEHDDTSSWVCDTLLSPEVVDYIRESQADFLLWGGNVQDSETYQVANSLRCTKFPFAALIVHTPNISSTAMSVVARITGNTTPTEFVNTLRTTITQNKESLDRSRATRAEQQASRSIREQQDSAYERSLAIDRERARQRREAMEAQQRAEQEAAAREAAEETKRRDLQQWKAWRSRSISDEPGPDAMDAVRVSIRLPSGERVVRKFAPDADIEELYAFVECYDLLQAATAEKAGSSVVGNSTMEVRKPERFEHRYDFRLVSPMPRTVYAVEEGGSISDRIGRGGNLLVESIEDSEGSEDEDKLPS